MANLQKSARSFSIPKFSFHDFSFIIVPFWLLLALTLLVPPRLRVDWRIMPQSLFRNCSRMQQSRAASGPTMN